MECLGMIVSNSSVGFEKAQKEERLQALIEEASQYGSREHLKLEQSAKRIIAALSLI